MYIVVNEAIIQKRLGELEIIEKQESINASLLVNEEIKTLKQILSQSTPFIPQVEKAFDAGVHYGKVDALFWCTDKITRTEYESKQDKEDYISNLKLEI